MTDVQKSSTVVRIGLIRETLPYITECAQFYGLTESPECENPGTDAELLGYALRYAGLRYESVYLNSSDFGDYKTGDYTGVLGAIYSGAVDTVALAWNNDADYPGLQYTFPVYQAQPNFVKLKNTRDTLQSMFSMLTVFDQSLWVTMAVTVLTLLTILLFLRKNGGWQTPCTRTMAESDTMWAYFRYCADQCFDDMTQNSRSGNIALVILGVMSILFTSLYQGCLLTRLLKKPEPAPEHKLGEIAGLISSGRFRFVADGVGDWFIKELSDTQSVSAAMQKLQAAVKKNPLQQEPDMNRLVEMLRTGQFIWPADELRAKYLLQNQQQCELEAISVTDSRPRWFAFLLRADNLLLPLINKAMVGTSETSESVMRKYTKTSIECLKKQKHKGIEVKPLDTLAMTGMYLILTTGCLAGFIGLVYEQVKWHVTKLDHQMIKIKVTNGNK